MSHAPFLWHGGQWARYNMARRPGPAWPFLRNDMTGCANGHILYILIISHFNMVSFIYLFYYYLYKL